MDVGLAIIFQGTDKGRTDLEVYQQELRLGCVAESLGYQSIWGVEHHFTDYTMCPDVLQMLTYFAGKSETLLLGSMVVVLPWHQPIRVAEQVSMLDNLSNGRLILGLGRALGETMAVTMLIGNRHEISASLFAPGYTLASVIANEFAEATKPLHTSALMACGAVLLIVTLVVNAIASWLVWSVAREPRA